MTTIHEGSCHCGGIRFAIRHDVTEVTTCDCSLCTMRGARMVKVPEGALTIRAGADLLSLYEWNTRRAKHHFCSRCGTYVFHRKRAAPDHFGVNAHCLDGLDLATIPVLATEGASMTVEAPDPRPEWPGPRVGRR